MVFHYHVQREELLIVLKGRLNLRSVADYGGLGRAKIVPPAQGPRQERGD